MKFELETINIFYFFQVESSSMREDDSGLDGDSFSTSGTDIQHGHEFTHKLRKRLDELSQGLSTDSNIESQDGNDEYMSEVDRPKSRSNTSPPIFISNGEDYVNTSTKISDANSKSSNVTKARDQTNGEDQNKDKHLKNSSASNMKTPPNIPGMSSNKSQNIINSLPDEKTDQNSSKELLKSQIMNESDNSEYTEEVNEDSTTDSEEDKYEASWMDTYLSLMGESGRRRSKQLENKTEKRKKSKSKSKIQEEEITSDVGDKNDKYISGKSLLKEQKDIDKFNVDTIPSNIESKAIEKTQSQEKDKKQQTALSKERDRNHELDKENEKRFGRDRHSPPVFVEQNHELDKENEKRFGRDRHLPPVFAEQNHELDRENEKSFGRDRHSPPIFVEQNHELDKEKEKRFGRDRHSPPVFVEQNHELDKEKEKRFGRDRHSPPVFVDPHNEKDDNRHPQNYVPKEEEKNNLDRKISTPNPQTGDLEKSSKKSVEKPLHIQENIQNQDRATNDKIADIFESTEGENKNKIIKTSDHKPSANAADLSSNGATKTEEKSTTSNDKDIEGDEEDISGIGSENSDHEESWMDTYLSLMGETGRRRSHQQTNKKKTPQKQKTAPSNTDKDEQSSESRIEEERKLHPNENNDSSNDMERRIADEDTGMWVAQNRNNTKTHAATNDVSNKNIDAAGTLKSSSSLDEHYKKDQLDSSTTKVDTDIPQATEDDNYKHPVKPQTITPTISIEEVDKPGCHKHDNDDNNVLAEADQDVLDQMNDFLKTGKRHSRYKQSHVVHMK